MGAASSKFDVSTLYVPNMGSTWAQHWPTGEKANQTHKAPLPHTSMKKPTASKRAAPTASQFKAAQVSTRSPRQPSAGPQQQASIERHGVPHLPQQRQAQRTKRRACPECRPMAIKRAVTAASQSRKAQSATPATQIQLAHGDEARGDSSKPQRM